MARRPALRKSTDGSPEEVRRLRRAQYNRLLGAHRVAVYFAERGGLGPDGQPLSTWIAAEHAIRVLRRYSRRPVVTVPLEDVCRALGVR